MTFAMILVIAPKGLPDGEADGPSILVHYRIFWPRVWGIKSSVLQKNRIRVR